MGQHANPERHRSSAAATRLSPSIQTRIASGPGPGSREHACTMRHDDAVPLSDVFASNIFVRWLRGDPGRYQLLTQMIGARLGDRLLTCGAGDPGMVAAMARVTGLSGRAVAQAAAAEEAARLEAAAERAGVLVEVIQAPAGALPFAEGDFDLVLIDAVSTPVGVQLPEARRVLRGGGRVVLVVRQKAAGAPNAQQVQQLTAEHFKGARVLLERDGIAIIEALKGLPAPLGQTDTSS